MPFFTYDQNNSGGGFDRDDEAGIGERVIVEAGTAEEANERAERIGLYFDGEGDCDCCGNRWSGVISDDEGAESPDLTRWAWVGDTFVHYADGRIERHETPTGEPKPTPKPEPKPKPRVPWGSIGAVPEPKPAKRCLTVSVERRDPEESVEVKAYKGGTVEVDIMLRCGVGALFDFESAEQVDEFVEALQFARSYAFKNNN